ncbi:MAG TPA: hypothetical protein VG206_16885 [Terriglobia bacterium]|nr:hypothetical protein [Terriglobia bacterium]
MPRNLRHTSGEFTVRRVRFVDLLSAGLLPLWVINPQYAAVI